MVNFQRVLNFWFHEIDSKLWFKKDDEFDKNIRELFLETYLNTVIGKNSDLAKTPDGRLAEIIVLDQFPRNMFRDLPEAFASDPLALQHAVNAVEVGDDQKIPVEKRSFIYLPLMHSEDRKVHEKAFDLFSQKGLEKSFEYELAHKKIIDRFGRFPHRNEILGRTSTAEFSQSIFQKVTASNYFADKGQLRKVVQLYKEKAGLSFRYPAGKRFPRLVQPQTVSVSMAIFL